MTTDYEETEEMKAARLALYAESPICPECKQPVIEGDRIHPYCARRSDHEGW